MKDGFGQENFETLSSKQRLQVLRVPNVKLFWSTDL